MADTASAAAPRAVEAESRELARLQVVPDCLDGKADTNHVDGGDPWSFPNGLATGDSIDREYASYSTQPLVPEAPPETTDAKDSSPQPPAEAKSLAEEAVISSPDKQLNGSPSKAQDSSESPLSDLNELPLSYDPTAQPDPPTMNGHIDHTSRTSPEGDTHQPSSLRAMEDDTGRPNKRRRTLEPTSAPSAPFGPSNMIPRQRAVSPPWKPIAAEGPSSFTENGRRKSGRVNTIPLELQRGDKRLTRRSFHTLKGGAAAKPKRGSGQTNGNGYQSSPGGGAAAHGTRLASTPMRSTKLRSGANGQRKSLIQETKSRTKTRRRPSLSSDDGQDDEDVEEEDDTSDEEAEEPTPPPPSRRKKALVSPARPPPSTGTRHSSRITTATPRGTGTTESPRVTRIKLKVRTPLSAIPLVHPGQVSKPLPTITSSAAVVAAAAARQTFPSFEEFFRLAPQIPVEEGGLLVSEDSAPVFTAEQARQEARIILRIEEEAEREGGLLTLGRCSAFHPEQEEEPARQWAHYDHLTRAVAGFRRLMLQEQQRHRAAAKRLAEACRVEWRRRNPQPKTLEEIEEEARLLSLARYRVVLRALGGTWENVKVEINRRRVEAWEAEEQKRVKAALNEAVTISEQKLRARKARFVDQGEEEMSDSGEEDDEEFDEEEDELEGEDGHMELDAPGPDDLSEPAGSGSENDESNMSSSDDDEKSSMLSDEGLTQDQLREKYANLPKLDGGQVDNEAVDEVNEEAGGDDTSDESIDMDDDLGSTDMDTSDEETDDGSGSDGDAEDSDVEPSGLLGFFGKSEAQKLKEAAVTHEEQDAVEEDTEMADAQPLVDPAIVNTETKVQGEPGMEDVSAPKDGLDTKLSEPTTERTIETGTVAPAKAQQAPATAPDVQVPALFSAATPHAEATVLNTIEADDLDHAMPDAPADAQPCTSSQQVGEAAEAIEPSDAKHTSPETDAVTSGITPSGSQSPRTSVTKPSEVDTASSVELVSGAKADGDSRSTSPQPATKPKTEIPLLLRGTLREYQHYGLDWLAGLYANKTNGILADEMGLGKTIQTIALLAHLACHHEVWGPHLIIVPTSVMLNWEMEFKKWCPSFKILTYYGNQEERKRKRHGWNNDDLYNVVITSYQMVLQDQQVFKRRRWHYMVLDEAHNIKNFKSQRWQTLLGFNTHSRLLLTGTPLQNNLTELWSLLFFLMPPENGVGGFADLREFHDWFQRPESQILEHGREQMDDEARAIIAKLHKVLRPYLLRRLKADVEKQMPAKYEHVEFCRLSKRQRELYDGFLARSDTRQTLSSGNYLSIINCLMQLRKVCNHPDLFVDRPIMTSFRMQRSVPSDFLVEDRVVRSRLIKKEAFGAVSLSFLNLIPTEAEDISCIMAEQIAHLGAHRILADLREAQKIRAQSGYTPLDPATIQSNIVYLESALRYGRFEELQHAVYFNALRRQRYPIYGKGLVNALTLQTDLRPYKPRPKIPSQVLGWFEDESFLMHTMIPTLPQRAASFETLLTKFACVTPAVVTRDANEVLLGPHAVQAFEETDLRLSAPVKYAPYIPAQPPPDPWHEARMRLSIQFPDRRLLQWDCGKLQALDRLLRRLQTGGHRALIFTQMTKVLDILEQFLNIHGHKYLRLDGATKVEQRQILTDRFNHDPRILVFILSTRSGGLGINLTGADTVIFYDQDWNPAMDRQCQDRCHRIGQTRDVHIYRLVSEHTIEANILRKAGQKQMLDDVVIQEGGFTTDYFTKNKSSGLADVVEEEEGDENGDAAVANAAMDRVLGGVEAREKVGGAKDAGRVLEQAEDREDVNAARVAEREIATDDADFSEKPGAAAAVASGQASGIGSREASTAPGKGGAGPGVVGDPLGAGVLGGADGERLQLLGEGGEEGREEVVEYNAFGARMGTVDAYMLAFVDEALRGTPLELPKDRKKGKKIKGKDLRKR